MRETPSTPETEATKSAMNFLGKLVKPPLKELGLLMADRILQYRFKNQVKGLQKAVKIVEENKLKVKEIPIKVLFPLLEGMSLEDDDVLLDKWAAMLANMADSRTNFENHVLPYVLSQISKSEYEKLQLLFKDESSFLEQKRDYEHQLELDVTDKRLHELDVNELNELYIHIKNREQQGFLVFLEPLGTANLIRLGLIRRLPPALEIQPFKTSRKTTQRHQLKAKYVTTNYGFRITELGTKFIEVCEIKKEEK